MKKLYITGSSSGIGLALSNLFLEIGFEVEGMARRNVIKHPNYIHHTLDLSDLKLVSDFKFSINGEVDEVVLINNAGWLGEVKPIGELQSENIQRINEINITAPFILINSFLSQLKSFGGKKTIINISSGAAQYPIKSWGGYCASKAAIDMFSRVIKEEHPEIAVMSIAPGVVDTAMQKAIREVPAEHFEDSARFHDMHNSGELRSSDDVAKQIAGLLENKEKALGTVFSLREL
jgi:benzil reductase ((S)-benzoin forming)